MKVHLVDGTYELFRAFYGAPSSLSPSGQEVGATRALGRSMLNLLGDKQVTHLGCAFDHVIESFRNDLFAGYKTGAGIDPALYGQFSLAEEMTQALGIVTWPMIEFEADDAIATFAARAADSQDVTQVVICSPDKDFAQIVQGERVVLFDRMRNKLSGETEVLEKFGVAPASIPDWLALVGDTADGIPGVAKWGPKSAASVLAVYQHVEHIPEHAQAWSVKVRGAPALASSLAEAKTDVVLYRTLAQLRIDAPLREELDDLRWQGPNVEALQDLATRLGDDRIVDMAQRAFAQRA
jgi:5'-3' exonuclease